MIKRLTREVIQMTIIILVMYLIVSIIKFIGAGVLVMYLIASIIKFIGAGGQELITSSNHSSNYLSNSGYELDSSSTHDIMNI